MEAGPLPADAQAVTLPLDRFTVRAGGEFGRKVAVSFNDWPGLLAKIRIGDAAAHRDDGIYLFADAISAERSRSTPQFTGLAADPAIADLSVGEFDVLEDLSARTAGELLVQLRAGV